MSILNNRSGGLSVQNSAIARRGKVIYLLTIAIIGFGAGALKKNLSIYYKLPRKRFFLDSIRKNDKPRSSVYNIMSTVLRSFGCTSRVLILIFFFTSLSGDTDIQFINVISRSRITITSRNGKH